MGAYRILFWPAEHEAASPGAFTALEDCLTNVGGTDPLPWTALVCLHRHTPVDKRILDGAREINERSKIAFVAPEMHVVTFAEGDNKTADMFLVNRQQKQTMAAGPEIKSILESYMKLKVKSSLSIEGSVYKAGDFRIALLRAIQRPTNHFKGIVVCVEYLPVRSSTSAGGVLDDMAERFKEAAFAAYGDAKIMAIPDVHGDFGLSNEDFGQQHLAVQLLQLALVTKSV